MSLGLTVATKAPVVAWKVRALDAADVALLDETPAPKSTIARIRSKHHALARAIAAGMTNSEAAIAVGLASGTVSSLKGDPTFAELVRHYEEGAKERFLGMMEKLGGLAEDLIDELEERLRENPKQFKVSELDSLLRTMADRAGYGPSSKTTVNVNVGIAERLAEARKRITVIDMPTIAAE